VEAARPALEWLEEQVPPVIQAPTADTRPASTSYVPPADHNTQPKVVEHPVYRARKPREFPVAYPLGKPIVRYGWKAEPPKSIVETLDSLCARLSHVGTAHSMAVAQAYQGALAHPTLEPGPEGDDYLRIVVPGRLQELEGLYQREAREVRRPPSGFEPLGGYRDCSRRTPAVDSPFDTVHILRIRGITHGLESAGALARALRGAVMEAMEGAPPPAVEGAEDRRHVAWLPLSDVGHSHARGRVLGMALAFPRDMDGEGRLAVLEALGRVQEWGLPLPDDRRVLLAPPDPERLPPQALRLSHWTRPAQDWTTVTPVIPDRLPRKRNPEARSNAVRDSLIRAGFPTPEAVVPFGHALWQGAPGVSAYTTRLPRFHAWVRFPQPVEGPVVAGRMRYFGIGLFRPWE
jgi:CRISPR-associated protein Csb2